MSKQYTLTEKEKQELLNSRHQKQPYKMKGHSWKQLKGVGKNVCACCGLMILRNKATDWCVDKGCNYEDHNSYESAMKRLTKQQW